MPLLIPSSATAEPSPADILASLPAGISPLAPHFLVFMASIDGSGQPWCPDCVNAIPGIEKEIPEDRSTIVWVGQRDAWKDSSNVFRKTWDVQRIPTVVKLTSKPNSVSDIKVQADNALVETDVLAILALKDFAAPKSS